MKKLLIIDEDITQFENINLFLKRSDSSNYYLNYAKTPLEGLAAYHLFLPDFVVIGFVLPISEKMSIVKQIRQRSHQTKIIVLCQTVWMDFIQGATEGYADAYLKKPVTESDFLLCLNNLIS